MSRRLGLSRPQAAQLAWTVRDRMRLWSSSGGYQKHSYQKLLLERA
jgi:hypothetical protein